MENHLVDRVDNLIHSAKGIVIVVGEHPNLDMMGAGLGLYLSLTKMGKKVQIICISPTTVALGNLVGIDKVRQRFEQGGANGLIISLPYQQGSIEKISYDIVGEKINLTVVPGPQGLNFTTDDIGYQSPSTEGADLFFTIGIASEDELYRTIKERGQGAIVNIDTNLQNTGFGMVSLVDERFSSNCEIVTDLLATLNIPIDIDSAQNLLSGIVEETDNFQSQKTSAFALELSALLMKKGASRLDTRSRIEPQLSQPFAQRKPRVTPGVHTFGSDATPSPSQLLPTHDKHNNNQQDQPQKQRKFDQKGAPKDWFEPRIFKGSTPVS